jgi:uncharacterized protein
MTQAPPERSYFWAAAEGPGVEHLRLRLDPLENVAHGLLLGVEDGVPYRLAYKIKWGADWRTRKVTLEVQDARGARERMLKSDGHGNWKDENGDPLPELEGCLDVDIAASPFTNTLPVRRLALKPGQSAEIKAAYVALPGLAVRADPQRYSCKARGAQGQTVLYEGLASDFTAELPLDADGMVIDYPGLFRRLAPR